MKNQRYLQNLFHCFKSIGVELLILFAVLFTINNYIGNVDRRISADGIGYYEYLPSLFIHHDLNRKDISVDLNHSKYTRVSELDMYVDFKDRWVNKYPSGTAILQSPFFLTTLVLTERTHSADDGYQQAFQRSVFYAALFYLFLSLVFLKRLLRSYSISTSSIILSQVLLVFATSVLNYVNFESAFSHVYSLFAITAFLYVARIYFTQKKLTFFLWACLLLGLIFILRQVNILIFFFLPFVAKHPRSCVAVNPCCLHNFFTVSKSASFDAASNFAFSSASYFSCAAISSSRCCVVVMVFILLS